MAPTRRRSWSPPTRPSPTRSSRPSSTSSRRPHAPHILAVALRDAWAIALAQTLDAAIDFVNAYGPEHLSVDVEPLEPIVARLRNAGSLFVGPWAPESAGDYATGANHVLPTGGLARGLGRPRRSSRTASSSRSSGSTATDSPRSAPRSRTLAEAEGLSRIATPSRSASGTEPDEPHAGDLQRRRMRPSTYSWEATDEEVAARYGLDPSTHRPVRPEHLARPALARPASAGGRPVRRRRCPNIRRPTTAVWSRPPPPAMA